MTAPRYTEKAPAPDASDESYRLISVQTTTAPSGNAGRDWLMYRIAQGQNVITGYRRGDRDTVTADVEKIVIALNERRGKQRGGKSDARPGRRPAAAPAPVTTPEGEGA